MPDLNPFPHGSLECARLEAERRSKLYRMTCYVNRLSEHYADEHGVYGWYCYDYPPLPGEGTTTAIFTNGVEQL